MAALMREKCKTGSSMEKVFWMLKNIIGTYVYSDGRKYIGEWANGKTHGKGKYF